MNENGESKIRKILFNEGTFIIAIIGLTVSFTSYFLSPSSKNAQDIQELKIQMEATAKISSEITNLRDNRIHTLQGDVNELKSELEMVKQSQVRIETILNERLPAKRP